MSNVLLSSIGTGIYNKEDKSRMYNNAAYVLGDGNEEIKTAYIYDALIEFRNINKIIFIGTAGSNWFLMYEHLYTDESKIKTVLERDENYSDELLELYENKTHPTMDVKKVKAKLQKLIDTMGDICLDIIILHYGLTEAEMNANFNLLAEAKQLIGDDDNLSFDMTHSFRSLAFYELLALNYFKLSMKNSDSIDFISYGMFEYKSYNNGKTPIIDQSPILHLLEWTKAADEYRRFGTTYLIDALINKEEMTQGLTKRARSVLKRLGDVVTSNNLEEIRKMVVDSHRVVRGGTTGNHAVDFIFKDIDDRFGAALSDGDKPEERIRLNIELALWHMDKKRYIASAITMTEAILEYCRKITEIPKDDDSDLRKALNSYAARRIKNKIFREFADSYKGIRNFRNKLCHTDAYNSNEELKKFKECIVKVTDLFENKLINNTDNLNKFNDNIKKIVKKMQK